MPLLTYEATWKIISAMNKRKKDYVVRVTAIPREQPDLKKLARALIAVAEEDLRQNNEFVKFLKSQNKQVKTRETDGWTIFEFGKSPFAAFNDEGFCCRLSKDICVNELKLEGAKKWPKGEDGTVALENRNFTEWKKLSLRSLKYMIELQAK